MASTKDADLTCLCGAVRESGSLLAGNTFPVETYLCHCNTCRYSSGGLFNTVGDLRGEPSSASLANCTAYAASGRLTQYFCMVCGSLCFAHRSDQQRWMAFSGIITPREPNKDVVRIASQRHVGDTGDYQLACRLYQADVPCYRQDNEQPPLTRDELLHPPPATGLPKKESLDARCHCGAVSFQLLPARDWDQSIPIDPIVIPPEGHRDKFAANFCGCRSCRLALGTASLQPWMFVARDRAVTAGNEGTVIFSDHDMADEHHKPLDGLRHYRSSPDVVRSFCGTCGATAFYRSTDEPQLLNVAVGLLRASEGSAAANWMWWRWEHVFGTDDHVDHSLVAWLRGAE